MLDNINPLNVINVNRLNPLNMFSSTKNDENKIHTSILSYINPFKKEKEIPKKGFLSKIFG
ncbi:hypothetical protein BTW14_gp178 [BeAn 58058 virus]|uniref:hypothetical protein n=1 Tax=BeAn 58058 virus TaxID=67082 RepID=UPI00090BE0F0|nr:hypothetical protein BTW14_gp178 [BeAn 58058 virus]APG58369.1 hypothetical protein BAV00193 [BeAn 58058 virus]